MLRSFFLLGALVMAACLFFGCGDRSQAQIASDARAIAQAYQGAKTPSERAPIADALAAEVIACLANYPDLPDPSTPPGEILARIDSVAAQTKLDQANPPPYEGPKSGPADPATGLHGWLERWGERLTIYGGCILGAAALLFVLSFWPVAGAWITPWALWIEEAAVAGGFVLLLGAAMRWLGDHLWVVYAVAAAAVVVVAIRNRRKWWPLVRRLVDPPHARARTPTSPTAP